VKKTPYLSTLTPEEQNALILQGQKAKTANSERIKKYGFLAPLKAIRAHCLDCHRAKGRLGLRTATSTNAPFGRTAWHGVRRRKTCWWPRSPGWERSQAINRLTTCERRNPEKGDQGSQARGIRERLIPPYAAAAWRNDTLGVGLGWNGRQGSPGPATPEPWSRGFESRTPDQSIRDAVKTEAGAGPARRTPEHPSPLIGLSPVGRAAGVCTRLRRRSGERKRK